MLNKSDETLVKEYKNGDIEAFNEIYSRFKGTVKFFTRNLYLLGADDDDLMQEGMIGLMKACNTYSEDKSSFKTYATVCIKNSLYSAVKKFSSQKNKPLNISDSLDDEHILSGLSLFSVTPEDEVINKEKIKELRFKIYSSLSKLEILVLELFLDGLSYNDIALKTGKTVKSIDGALSRARKKIKNCIGE